MCFVFGKVDTLTWFAQGGTAHRAPGLERQNHKQCPWRVCGRARRGAGICCERCCIWRGWWVNETRTWNWRWWVGCAVCLTRMRWTNRMESEEIEEEEEDMDVDALTPSRRASRYGWAWKGTDFRATERPSSYVPLLNFFFLIQRFYCLLLDCLDTFTRRNNAYHQPRCCHTASVRTLTLPHLSLPLCAYTLPIHSPSPAPLRYRYLSKWRTCI